MNSVPFFDSFILSVVGKNFLQKCEAFHEGNPFKTTSLKNHRGNGGLKTKLAEQSETKTIMSGENSKVELTGD